VGEATVTEFAITLSLDDTAPVLLLRDKTHMDEGRIQTLYGTRW